LIHEKSSTRRRRFSLKGGKACGGGDVVERATELVGR
jgi:hypothetical protein